MENALNDHDFRRRLERLEKSVQEIEQFPDPVARARTREIVQTLLELHGTGLEKILSHIANCGEQGLAIIDALAEDDLIGSLLLLYDLHPLDLEGRVRQALDRLGPTLGKHGAQAELVSVRDGVVCLRLVSDGKGPHSTGETLRAAIEEALYEKGPDIASVVVEEIDRMSATTNGKLHRVTLPVCRG